MNCHICANQATGQCRVCWKFYCADHGDLVCQPCQGQRGTSGSPGGWQSMGIVYGQHRPPGSPRVNKPVDIEAQPLERVIGVGQAIKHGNTEIALVSLELYASGAMLNCRLRKDPPDGPGSRPVGTTFNPEFSPEAIEVIDDLGNKFQVSPRGGGGGRDIYWRTSMKLEPEIPAQSKDLRIAISEVQWFAHRSLAESFAVSGPWEFNVSLE